MSVAVVVRVNGRTAVAANAGSVFNGVMLTQSLSSRSYCRRFGGAVVTSVGWGVYATLLETFRAEGQWKEPADTTSTFTFFRAFRQWMDESGAARKDGGDDDESPFGDFDSDFLVGTPGAAFVVTGNASVIPITRYFAIGSGGNFAMGALHVLYDEATDAADLARRAAETAGELSDSCGGGVEVHVAGQA